MSNNGHIPGLHTPHNHNNDAIKLRIALASVTLPASSFGLTYVRGLLPQLARCLKGSNWGWLTMERHVLQCFVCD
jgi:hypothetical protein